MSSSPIAPGIYWTRATSPGDDQDRWADLDDVAFLPKIKESERYGTCLALSGGGYRAALFHLGVLRRLNEIGMLGYIDTVACVSGGSFTGAFLAQAVQADPDWWPAPGESIPVDEWNGKFARPVRDHMRRDIRSLSVLLGAVSRVTGGFELGRISNGVETIERQIRGHINDGKLSDLPEKPRFLFCSSEIERGDYWLFGRDHVGPHGGPFKLVLPDYPIARAVAASACFPPVFAPQQTDFWGWLQSLPEAEVADEDTGPAEIVLDKSGYPFFLDLPSARRIPISSVPENVQAYLQRVRLSDGGVFDNNAIEATWPHATRIVVSDAGGPFQVSEARWMAALLKRYWEITSNVASESQTRWLTALNTRAELPSIFISSKSYESDTPVVDEQAEPRRYPLHLRRTISQIRTDLDSFTDPEIAILENHGYWEANHAIRKSQPTEVAPGWESDTIAPDKVWMSSAEVESALQESHRIKVQGHRGWLSFFKAWVGLLG